MFLQKTNIERELSRVKSKSISTNTILNEVHQILEQETFKELDIEKRLSQKSKCLSNNFDLNLLETSRVFYIDQIEKICTDYRLRFLDTKYFKGKIPITAFSKIKQLEKNHDIQINGFKIMAPSKLFKLEDKDDPLLFAPIGNGYFYLIHKWGNDLHPLRKILVWPFKGIVNLTITTLIISYFATLAVPNGLFSKSDSTAEFWIVYFFMFKSIAAVVIFYGFALGKNFNPAIWNSKYFNA
ncbi:hypothetical protein [Croceitalea rosinachiae]|uniref:Uncharacterized protein n=1 Tax=Croceitalea rosinachiae TaxID=3075596 RepID=A0ABU3AAV1_9FLAO|nr:hypothetical protein [Croceitalea sp. F388]MDT0607313.1 hypothetical protein [Croceitalea sp. F388]